MNVLLAAVQTYDDAVCDLEGGTRSNQHTNITGPLYWRESGQFEQKVGRTALLIVLETQRSRTILVCSVYKPFGKSLLLGWTEWMDCLCR